MSEKEIAEKLKKVLKSCKTAEQIGNAYNYFKLWEKRFPEHLLQTNKGLICTSFWCYGFFIGSLYMLKNDNR